jgi:transposase
VALEARLFPASMALAAIKSRRPQADWPAIHRELKRPGVTLQLLWEEHRAAHPEGYGYSRYVAPGFMLRGGRRARDTALSAGPRGT